MRLNLDVFCMAYWLVAYLMTVPAYSDEGMWLFSAPPQAQLKEKYQFDITPTWLEHIQKSAVRFSNGGSGAFISADGLVITNFHVGSDSIQKLSTKENDYVKDGFLAKMPSEELPCPDLELNVLLSMQDVTDKVNKEIKNTHSFAEASDARQRAISNIEKESFISTGLRSEVVTLFQGGKYHLYRYKKYTDVRLAFSPEKMIAFFGTDWDFYEYPRYQLDACLFRVYEDDKPAKIEHYLQWSDKPVTEGQLLFIAGHPGQTQRLNTLEHLKFIRDVYAPYDLANLNHAELLLSRYSKRGPEYARQAEEELFNAHNNRIGTLESLDVLQNPAFMSLKEKEEKILRTYLQEHPEISQSLGDPWKDVSASLTKNKAVLNDFSLLEQGTAFDSTLFNIARTLLRLSEETKKPNGERLPEFRDSNLESLKFELFSEAPIYKQMEQAKLANSLLMLANQKGRDDPLVVAVLAGKSPHERAYELINGTRLDDVSFRQKLSADDAALSNSTDSLIMLARLVDPQARLLRRIYRTEIDEPQQQAYAKITQIKMAAEGQDFYPDATFTLRLAFGIVKDFERQGKKFAPWTTFGGLFETSEAGKNIPPFELPKRWIDGKNKLSLSTIFNFIFTADMVGGNSGSPVIDQSGKCVGVVFEATNAAYFYPKIKENDLMRTTAVAAVGIKEALLKVYAAKELVTEIEKGYLPRQKMSRIGSDR